MSLPHVHTERELNLPFCAPQKAEASQTATSRTALRAQAAPARSCNTGLCSSGSKPACGGGMDGVKLPASPWKLTVSIRHQPGGAGEQEVQWPCPQATSTHQKTSTDVPGWQRVRRRAGMRMGSASGGERGMKTLLSSH